MTPFFLKHSRARAVPRGLTAVIFLIGLLGLPAPSVRAGLPVGDILFVTPAGSGLLASCADWTNSCTLQRALSLAVSGDAIWVKQGLYSPGPDRADTFQLKTGVEIYGGFEGTPGERFDQRNPNNALTVLSGENVNPHSGDNSYHVVTGTGVDSTAILDDFTITGGYADGATSIDKSGGGMINNPGSPTLVNIDFLDNYAFSQGGGLYNAAAGEVKSDAHLSDCSFTSNEAGSGGGMVNVNSNPVLSRVIFTGNHANSVGGGMANVGNPILTDVIFAGNTAADGAGLRNTNSSPSINRAIFKNNISSSFGGGIENWTSSPTLTNVTFFQNSATNQGGGMINQLNSFPQLKNVTFKGNSAIHGGAIANLNSSPTIVNGILWGDTATGQGNEIFNDNSSSTVSYSDVQGGFTGVGNIDKDPLLGSLGTYGGKVDVLPLLPGSPAIGLGDNGNCASTDARNVSRPPWTPCDMGAFESRGFTLALAGGDHQSTDILTAFPDPLAVTVTSSFGEPVDGGLVRFSKPITGPSAVLSSATGSITGGAASVTATANVYGGSYEITADASGGSNSVIFHLTNRSPYNLFLPMICK